jgi:hypothetical protein
MTRHPLVPLVFFLGLGLLPGCRTTALCADHAEHAGSAEDAGHVEHAEHGHHDEPERPPPLCLDLCRGWFACVDHAHESRRGTPYVHAFHVEPAFLGRDLLVHAEKEGDEHGLEAELEFALTRRLLIVAEVPYRWTDEEDGVGDAGLSLRGLLVETDRLLVSAQLGFEFPTAREGLGADEIVVAPGLLAWSDLGCWWTAQAGITFAHGTETGDAELSWGAVLAKSFALRPLLTCGWPGAHGDEHAHPSFLTLFVEGRGIHPLAGPEEGTSTHELLFGISAPVTAGLEARAGWTLRWDEADDAASGWVLGFVVHL